MMNSSYMKQATEILYKETIIHSFVSLNCQNAAIMQINIQTKSVNPLTVVIFLQSFLETEGGW